VIGGMSRIAIMVITALSTANNGSDDAHGGSVALVVAASAILWRRRIRHRDERLGGVT